MYIPEFWVGFIVGALVGIFGLIVAAVIAVKDVDDDEFAENYPCADGCDGNWSPADGKGTEDHAVHMEQKDE